jgi:hypothetical protein
MRMHLTALLRAAVSDPVVGLKEFIYDYNQNR